jgi:hypothetical protein
MNKMNIALGLTFLANITLSVGLAHADQFRLPEEIGRIEAPRDMHLFQVEPTTLDEEYYTSGRDERHQFIGNTLPSGADIPDSDFPVSVGVGVGGSSHNQAGAQSGQGASGAGRTIIAPSVVPMSHPVVPSINPQINK